MRGGGEVLTAGAGRGRSTGRIQGKNVIRESAMSNLQQSHHLTSV